MQAADVTVIQRLLFCSWHLLGYCLRRLEREWKTARRLKKPRSQSDNLNCDLSRMPKSFTARSISDAIIVLQPDWCWFASTGPSERGLGRAIFRGQDDFMDEVRTSSGEVELTEFEPRLRRHPHSSSTSRLDDSYAGTREGTCFPCCSSICPDAYCGLCHLVSTSHASIGFG